MSGEDDTERKLSFWTKFRGHVTYLPILPQGKQRFELSYRGNL